MRNRKIHYPKHRKSPHHHIVKSHSRKGRPVRQFVRGSELPKPKPLIKRRTLTSFEKLKRKPSIKKMLKNIVIVKFVLPFEEREEHVITTKSLVEQVKTKYLKRGWYLKEDFERLKPLIREHILAKDNLGDLRRELKETIEELEGAKKDLAFVEKRSNLYRGPSFREPHLKRIKKASENIPKLKKEIETAKIRRKKANQQLQKAKGK